MIDPVRTYEINGEVCTVKTAAVGLAIGTNLTAIAALSGRIIRVMGCVLQGNGGVSVVTLKNGTGGATLFGPVTVPSSASAGTFLLPITDSGYFETTSGTGLFADIATTAGVLNLFYLDYKPR